MDRETDGNELDNETGLWSMDRIETPAPVHTGTIEIFLAPLNSTQLTDACRKERATLPGGEYRARPVFFDMSLMLLSIPANKSYSIM